MGNEICAMETPEYADMWCLLMPFFPPCCMQPNGTVRSCLSGLSPLHSSSCFCLLPLSRQPHSHSSYEAPCVEGSPRSANTWLSLHVHSHLIMGEALTSQSFQHVGMEARRKQQSHKIQRSTQTTFRFVLALLRNGVYWRNRTKHNTVDHF